MSDRPRDPLGRPLPRGSPDALQKGAEPRSVDEARRRGIHLFDEKRFFEAHECFEWIWKSPRTGEPDRAFWKGVTQVAVGCCHLQRGNRRGALALLERAARYLEPYPKPYHEIDTAALIALAQGLAAATRVRCGDNIELEFPRFPRRAG